ncbi:ribonuclease kappa-like [Tropilaelaps mercedesae]|uniref:Ribonuclease kappa-like n=1 Tax=Tropilaelaps mercedesae TaxID=418985 RepID=A0A1V9X9L1_9ACAR|nr:ribonuclease kappa-like [Tropilaelaps mercedesae]
MSLCGKKCAILCSLLSLWGLVMLGLMSLFFYMRAGAFLNDLEDSDLPKETSLFLPEKHYETAGRNCSIAAILYSITMVVSLILYYADQRANAC